MKTRRKPRQRLFPLDFATPPNVVPHERGKALFARIRELLQSQCDVRDSQGRHCPNPPTHYVGHQGSTVALCDRCWQTWNAGAYDSRTAASGKTGA